MKLQSLAGLSSQEREIISHFSALESLVITADDIIKLKSINRTSANQILRRLAFKGWLLRLKQGIYSIVPISSTTNSPILEDILSLATTLFKPAFISGWTAAEHWNLTEQIFNSISVSTLSPQRKNTQMIGNVKFRIRVLKENQFFGYKTLWQGSKSFNIADPSRTIIDILDLPRFGGGGRHMVDIMKIYLQSEHFNPDLLLDYARQFNHGSIFKRLGFLVEKLNGHVQEDWLRRCQSYITKGITYLDPDGKKKGDITTKWNLRINIPI